MKRSLILAIIFSVLFWFEGLSFAGQRHVAATHQEKAQGSVSRAGVAPLRFERRHGRQGAPSKHRRRYYYGPNYRPPAVISPYPHYFYVPTPVVANAPFFASSIIAASSAVSGSSTICRACTNFHWTARPRFVQPEQSIAFFHIDRPAGPVACFSLTSQPLYFGSLRIDCVVTADLFHIASIVRSERALSRLT
jgi:hypothetical protein